MTPAHIIEAGCAMRESGATVTQIMSQLGGTESAWRYHLLACGAERHGVVPRRPSVSRWDDQIATLRRNGESIGAIARCLHVRKSYVQQRLLYIARREAWEQEAV